MTPGRVLAELIALDWGSWGKGATVPELVSALEPVIVPMI